MAGQISLVAAIKKQLDMLQTETNLQEAIVSCLDSTLADRNIHMQGPFHMALEAQSSIGWLGMLQGYWSKEWQKANEQSYLVPTEETCKQKKKM
jgi:hypothetical protein